MSDAAPTQPLRTEAHADFTRVWFSEQPDDAADFHHVFLRHNADTQRHPTTGEQLLCSSEIAAAIAPTQIDYDSASDGLVVRWNDGSPPARYSRRWLREFSYGRSDLGVRALPTRLEDFEFHGASQASLGETAAQALARVRRDGVVIVRSPQTQEAALRATEPLIEAFLRQGLTVRETHFGRIEDLRPDNTTNANNDQLGYTDAPIELHTDQPFIQNPPRYQLLQGIVPAASGGENAFVDAFLAAEHLRAREEVDHELLATTRVRFHRKQKAFESVVEAPILSYAHGADASGFQVRYSYFTLAPHRLPFARMSAYYRAYERFARLLRNPRNQLVARLGAGDFVLYDNHRLLHARKPFRGHRWVRGVYFDPSPGIG